MHDFKEMFHYQAYNMANFIMSLILTPTKKLAVKLIRSKPIVRLMNSAT